MYAAGLRNGELCRLKVSDIDFDRGTIRVHQGKGGADRWVMLPKTFSAQLRAMCEGLVGSDWIFPSLERCSGRHMSPRTLQRWVRTATELAGVNKRVTPHSFRHAFATHLLENGTDIRFIQKLLGHQRLETTTIYTRVAKVNTSSVASPLDRIALGNGLQQEIEQSKSDANRKPDSQQQSVGTLGIRMRRDENGQQAKVSLMIHGRSRQSIVLLEGITVRFDTRNWVQIELPSIERWASQLRALPVVQRDRIQSPEFYENIRAQISYRFLKLAKGPPG